MFPEANFDYMRPQGFTLADVHYTLSQCGVEEWRVTERGFGRVLVEVDRDPVGVYRALEYIRPAGVELTIELLPECVPAYTHPTFNHWRR